MRLSRTLGLALILSVGWHLFWGLFFDLSLEEKAVNSGGKIIPVVYYVGKSLAPKGRTMREAGTSSSFSQLTLPKTSLIQPPIPSNKLPQVDKETLDKKAKEIAEYKTEISLNKKLEPKEERKFLPNWILPKKPSNEKEDPIQWQTEKREVVQSYYPPYPDWAEEAGIISNVTLQIKVSKQGDVIYIQIERSSGETKLDLLAMDYLRRWKFLPSSKDIVSTGSITIEFGRK